MNGILLCGHGSKSSEGVAHFVEFSEKFKKRQPNVLVEIAFLELSEPTFEQAVDQLYRLGVRNIIAVPVFLFVGVHILEDIPKQLQSIVLNYANLSIRVAQRVAVSYAFDELLMTQLHAVSINSQNEHLLVVGVGSSVNEANEQISELAQKLSKKLSFNSFSVAYVSPVAQPSVLHVLSQLKKANKNKRIIVLPLILFSGVYFSKIINTIAEFEIVDACTLIDVIGNNPKLIDILWQSAQDVEDTLNICYLDGSQLMGLDCCSGE